MILDTKSIVRKKISEVANLLGKWGTILGIWFSTSFATASTVAYEDVAQLEGAELVKALVENDDTESYRNSPAKWIPLIRSGISWTETNDETEARIKLYAIGAIVAGFSGDQVLAQSFFQKAHRIAEEQDSDLGKAYVSKSEGYYYFEEGNLVKGIALLSEVAEVYEQKRKVSELVEVKHELAIHNAKLGNRNRARQHVDDALSISTGIDDLLLIGKSYQVSGMVHAILDLDLDLTFRGYLENTINRLRTESPNLETSDRYQQAIAPLENAISYFDQVGENVGKAECLQFKGDIMMSRGNYSSAQNYFQKAFQLYAANQGGDYFPALVVGLSTTLSLRNNYTAALNTIDTVLSKASDEIGMGLYQLKAETSLKAFDDLLARESLQLAIEKASKLQNNEQLSKLYSQLSEVDRILGEYDLAFKSERKSKEFLAKALHREYETKISSISDELTDALRVSSELRQNTDEQLQTGDRRQISTTLVYVAIPTGVALILFIILLFQVQRRKSQRSRLLELQSELKQCETKLSKWKDERNTTFLNLAQELRTPMNGVVGAINLLNDTKLDSVQENCYHIMEVSSRSIITLIDDISDLSRLESGALKLKETPFDPVATTEAVALLFRSDSQKTGLSLVCDVPSDLLAEVIGDAQRIQQILITLLARSFQNTAEGIINVKLEELQSDDKLRTKLRWTVENSGEPMSHEDVDQSFGLLAPSTNIHTSSVPASMLGMAIGKRIAEAMMGSVEVTPSKLGGTCTSVTIPLVKSPARKEASNLYERFPSHSALIISGDEPELQLISKHLRCWELGVQTQTRLDDALTWFHTHSPDVVFVNPYTSSEDLNILEQISAIRNSEQLESVPIVLIVSHEDYSSASAWKKQKYVHQIQAPVQVGLLHKTLKQALYFKSPLSQSFASLEPESVITRTEDPTDGKNSFQFKPFLLPFKSDARIDPDLKILLAEDNVVNQRVTALMLKKIGFAIDVVTNGKEAVKKVQEEDYDIVLMDKLMPVMDGIRATLEIRKLKLKAQPIIIALTASASLQDEMACRNATMDNFLSKPVPLEKMKAALAFSTSVISQRKN